MESYKNAEKSDEKCGKMNNTKANINNRLPVV